MESTVLTKNFSTTKQYLYFSGINHVSADDGETGVYNAYLEFAFHHSANDAEVYNNASSDSRLSEQKNLFMQLAFRKKEIADKLKMYRSDSSFAAERKQAGPSLAKHHQETASRTFTSMNDSLNFAFQRESRTLALYEKLAKTAIIPSIRKLFDYLLESQRNQILFLTTQCAAVNCMLS
jgi:hypothetical protein